ncbi:hypothetical protein DFH28DRAFT_1133199 [Melampsora americana]|nr:hypothetical protein DFH28DRAFT_1133199 [Melampsora americana]
MGSLSCEVAVVVPGGLGGFPSPMVATTMNHYGQNDRSGSWRCHSGVTPPATVNHSVINRGQPPKRLGGLPSPMVATTTPNPNENLTTGGFTSL